MRLRHILLLVIALGAPCVASAQPVAQSDYLWMVGPPPPGQNIHIPSVMSMWCDDTALIAATPPLQQACTPRVTSKYYPVPVQVIGGTSGSSTPTSAPGTAETQLVGVQGGGPSALAIAVTLPSGQTIAVNNFPATQAISAAALPLPSGATTAANQTTIVSNTGTTAGATRTNDAGTSRTQTHDDTLAAAQSGSGLSVAQKPTQSTPTETSTAIAAASTNFGTPGSYHALTMQAQGQAMCVTFGAGTLVAPTTVGVCAVGMYLAAGQGYTYTIAAIPSSQGKAIAAATGGTLWESVQ